MEDQILDSFLTNIPPEETVLWAFNLIKTIDDYIILCLSDVINLTKQKLISSPNQNKSTISDTTENVTKNLKININLNKEKLPSFNNYITLISGIYYTSPLAPYNQISLESNLNRYIMIELTCVDSAKAKTLSDEINNKILPRINEFPYYIAFKKFNGSYNFLTHDNKICLVLSRQNESIVKVIKLINELDLQKYNFGIIIELLFSLGINIAKIGEMNLNEFLDKLSTMSIKFDIKLINYYFLMACFIEALREIGTSEFKKISNFLKMALITSKIEFEFDLNPSLQVLIKDLNEIFPSINESVEVIFENLAKFSIMGKEFSGDVKEMFKKLGINFDYPDFVGLKINYCIPKLNTCMQLKFQW